MSSIQTQDSGGGILNNRFVQSKVGKYLMLVFLCLTTLSTIGLGISTGVLDQRYKILKKGYFEQATALQSCLKNQNNCNNSGGGDCDDGGTTYLLRNWVYNSDDQEEEYTKYVKINTVNLTTSNYQRRLRGEGFQVINSSIESFDGEIPETYTTINIQSDGSLMIGASNQQGEDISSNSNLTWGFPWSRAAIQSMIGVQGIQALVVDKPITGTAEDFAVKLDSVNSNQGSGVQVQIVNTYSFGVDLGTVSSNGIGIQSGSITAMSSSGIAIQVNDNIQGGSHGIQVNGSVQGGQYGVQVNGVVKSTTNYGVGISADSIESKSPYGSIYVGDVTNSGNNGIGINVLGSIISNGTGNSTGIYVLGDVIANGTSNNSMGINIQGNVINNGTGKVFGMNVVGDVQAIGATGSTGINIGKSVKGSSYGVQVQQNVIGESDNGAGVWVYNTIQGGAGVQCGSSYLMGGIVGKQYGIIIDGNVQSSNNGIWVTGSVTSNGTSIQANSVNGSTYGIQITGDVSSSSGAGISANSVNGSTYGIQITGDVSSSSGAGISLNSVSSVQTNDETIVIQGINTDDTNGGITKITVQDLTQAKPLFTEINSITSSSIDGVSIGYINEQEEQQLQTVLDKISNQYIDEINIGSVKINEIGVITYDDKGNTKIIKNRIGNIVANNISSINVGSVNIDNIINNSIYSINVDTIGNFKEGTYQGGIYTNEVSKICNFDSATTDECTGQNITGINIRNQSINIINFDHISTISANSLGTATITGNIGQLTAQCVTDIILTGSELECSQIGIDLQNPLSLQFADSQIKDITLSNTTVETILSQDNKPQLDWVNFLEQPCFTYQYPTNEGTYVKFYQTSLFDEESYPNNIGKLTCDNSQYSNEQMYISELIEEEYGPSFGNGKLYYANIQLKDLNTIVSYRLNVDDTDIANMDITVQDTPSPIGNLTVEYEDTTTTILDIVGNSIDEITITNTTATTTILDITDNSINNITITDNMRNTNISNINATIIDIIDTSLINTIDATQIGTINTYLLTLLSVTNTSAGDIGNVGNISIIGANLGSITVSPVYNESGNAIGGTVGGDDTSQAISITGMIKCSKVDGKNGDVCVQLGPIETTGIGGVKITGNIITNKTGISVTGNIISSDGSGVSISGDISSKTSSITVKNIQSNSAGILVSGNINTFSHSIQVTEYINSTGGSGSAIYVIGDITSNGYKTLNLNNVINTRMDNTTNSVVPNAIQVNSVTSYGNGVVIDEGITANNDELFNTTYGIYVNGEISVKNKKVSYVATGISVLGNIRTSMIGIDINGNIITKNGQVGADCIGIRVSGDVDTMNSLTLSQDTTGIIIGGDITGGKGGIKVSGNIIGQRDNTYALTVNGDLTYLTGPTIYNASAFNQCVSDNSELCEDVISEECLSKCSQTEINLDEALIYLGQHGATFTAGNTIHVGGDIISNKSMTGIKVDGDISAGRGIQVIGDISAINAANNGFGIQVNSITFQDAYNKSNKNTAIRVQGDITSSQDAIYVVGEVKCTNASSNGCIGLNGGMFATVNNSNDLAGLAINVNSDGSLSSSPQTYYMGDVNINDGIRVLSVNNVSSINVSTSDVILDVNGTFGDITFGVNSTQQPIIQLNTTDIVQSINVVSNLTCNTTTGIGCVNIENITQLGNSPGIQLNGVMKSIGSGFYVNTDPDNYYNILTDNNSESIVLDNSVQCINITGTIAYQIIPSEQGGYERVSSVEPPNCIIYNENDTFGTQQIKTKLTNTSKCLNIYQNGIAYLFMVDKPDESTTCSPYNRITSDNKSLIHTNTNIIQIGQYSSNKPSCISDSGSIMSGYVNMISGQQNFFLAGNLTSYNNANMYLNGNMTGNTAISINGNITAAENNGININGNITARDMAIYVKGNISSPDVIGDNIYTRNNNILRLEKSYAGVVVNGSINVHGNAILVNGSVQSDLTAYNNMPANASDYTTTIQPEQIGTIVIDESVISGCTKEKLFYNITGVECFNFTYNDINLTLYDQTVNQQLPNINTCQNISQYGITSEELISAMLTFTTEYIGTSSVKQQLDAQPELIFDSSFMTQNGIFIDFSIGDDKIYMFAYDRITNNFINPLRVNLDETQIGQNFLIEGCSAISIINGGISSGGQGIQLPNGGITASTTALYVGSDIIGDISVGGSLNGNIDMNDDVNGNIKVNNDCDINGNIYVDGNVKGISVGGINAGDDGTGQALYIGTTLADGVSVKGSINIIGSILGEIHDNKEEGDSVYTLYIGGDIQGNVYNLNIDDGDLTSLSITNTTSNRPGGNSGPIYIARNVVNTEMAGPLIVDGYVQGNGDSGNGAVVQLGGIITDDGTGQALFIGNAIPGDSVPVKGNVNIEGSILGKLSASCVDTITLSDGTCSTNFYNDQTTITGIQGGNIGKVSIGNNIQIQNIDTINVQGIADITVGQINIQQIGDGNINYISTQTISDLSAQTVTGSIGDLTCSSINSITISDSTATINTLTHGSTTINNIKDGSIESILTNSIGANNVSTAINVNGGVTCGDDGSGQTNIACINIAGQLTVYNTNSDAFYVNGITGDYARGIYVNQQITGATIQGVYVGGYIEGNTNNNAVVQLGGINASNGTGQALFIRNITLGDGVSVKGSINIEGNIISQTTQSALSINGGINASNGTGQALYINGYNFYQNSPLLYSVLGSVLFENEIEYTPLTDTKISALECDGPITSNKSSGPTVYLNSVNNQDVVAEKFTGTYDNYAAIRIDSITSIGTSIYVGGQITYNSTENTDVTKIYGIYLTSPTTIKNGNDMCPST